MLNSRVSAYVQSYLSSREVTPSEAKELYHRFDRVLSSRDGIKKVWSKCVAVECEYQKEREDVLELKRSVESIRGSRYLKAAQVYGEIKSMISDYVNEVSSLSNEEEAYRRRLRQMDDEVAELSSRLTSSEKEYKEKVEMKWSCDSQLGGLMKENQDLTNRLMMRKLGTLALESCSRVKSKGILGMEEALRELEDSTRCILGMISQENTAILSVRSEYAQINEEKRNMEKCMESERDRLARSNRDSRARIEQLSRKIASGRRQIQQLKGEERRRMEVVDKLNVQVGSLREKSSVEEEASVSITKKMGGIKVQLAELEERSRVIKYLWETKRRDLDVESALEDEEIVQQARQGTSSRGIDMSSCIRENGELMIKKNALMEEIEILKQELSEQDSSSYKMQKAQVELTEQITRARTANARLLKKQRELSSREDRVVESRQRLLSIKSAFEEISKKRSDEVRQCRIKELTELTEKLGRRLIQENPKVNITVERLT
ncbi:hypothetical protein OIY81_1428 [Cryptosporidium canis]|nr:hypothetical protein OIY81_1428 [Cryptosporidium canis]